MPFRLENWPAAPRCAAYLAVFCAQVPCRTAPQQSVRPWLKAQFACRKGHASNHHAEATAFSPLVCPRVPYRRKQKCDLPSRSVERAQGYAGIISDVQYADIPDGASFSGIPRYYRTSLAILRSAVSGWRDAGVDFCVHLGDIVDGFNPRELAEGALDLVVGEFEKLEKPHYHMIGNHCLYNIPRKVLNRKLHMIGPGGPDGGSYYSFCPHSSWRFVVLDGYDLSVLGWPEGHPLHEQAVQILAARNPNKDKNNPTRPPDMSQLERRFVKFGGGFSASQLSWLREELSEARRLQQHALIFCHLPLHPGTCQPACLAWNYEEVLEVIRDFRDVCVATFAGHSHRDGIAFDENGIYHRALKGVVETPSGQDCAGVVSIHSDRVEFSGSGIQSVSLPLKQI